MDDTLLENAIINAALSHEGQKDKSGQPYMLHPLRVMLSLLGDTDAMMVGVLHDVIEDTNVDEDHLRNHLEYPDHIVDAVVALSRPPKDAPNRPTHAEYILSLKDNPLARKVKLADLQDNMDPVRMSQIDQGEAKGLMKRYKKAVAVLTNKQPCDDMPPKLEELSPLEVK